MDQFWFDFPPDYAQEVVTASVRSRLLKAFGHSDKERESYGISTEVFASQGWKYLSEFDYWVPFWWPEWSYGS